MSTRLEDAVQVLLKELGEDPEREGLQETPNRVARYFLEATRSLREGPPDLKVFTNEEGYDQMIIVKEIPYYSLCEHHLVTFFGKAAVGYLPKDKYVGLSKIARVVEYFSRKPQVQERLTQEVADYLYENLNPEGVIVLVTGRHMCVESRGVEKPGTETVTCAIRGKIDKTEFLSLAKM